MYTVWNKEEMFENFEPGFYFIKAPNRTLRVIKLTYGFDGTKVFQEGSRTRYLCLLSEKAILWGPIPTPRIGD